MTADRQSVRRTLLAASLAGVACLASAGSAAADLPSVPAGFTASVFATAPVTTPPTAGPDDIASLGANVFVGWQNGVDTMGQPNPTTHQDSGTLVEYAPDGSIINTYSLPGKIDGLGGDPLHRRIIATVNEDGNSSLYTITPSVPGAGAIVHYTYSPAPDSAATGGVLTGGGSDAVAVYGRRILLSASAPSAPNATATFQATLTDSGGSHIAKLTPTFADDATATDAVTGQGVQLALTDPDSNAVVPFSSRRFGGQFVLDSQGDQELVFARGLGFQLPPGILPASLTDPLPGFFEGFFNFGPVGSGGLTRLALNKNGSPAGVDDVRWIGDSGRGTLYVVGRTDNTIYAITGPFAPGQAFGAADTPTNTELDQINLATGELTPFATGLPTPKGLLWVQ